MHRYIVHTPTPVAIMVTTSKGAYIHLLMLTRTNTDQAIRDKIHPIQLTQSLQNRPWMMDGGSWIVDKISILGEEM
jgi:hypothetical protein